jgi:hypothetical protein
LTKEWKRNTLQRVNPPEEARFHAIHGIHKLVELHGKSMLSTTILILQEMPRVGSGLVEEMLREGHFL